MESDGTNQARRAPRVRPPRNPVRETRTPGSARGRRETGVPASIGSMTRMKQQLTAAFVCLHCRKVFKRPSHRRVGNAYKALDYSPRCPHCRIALARVGDAFHAPPKEDLAAWERVERDLNRGRTFIRDEGFGRPPVPPKRQHTPKGVHSLFQLPARKRRRRAEPDATHNSLPPSHLPASPEVQWCDSQRSPSSGGCG